MRTRRLCSTGPLAVALTLALAATAGADEVVLISNTTYNAPGGRVRGQIQGETPTSVQIQATVGGAQEIPVDQIEQINYDGQPASLPLAQTRESAGAMAEAAELYQKSATEAAGKPLIATAAEFGRARSLAQLALADPSKADEAIGLLDRFIQAHPKSRQLGPALETLARLNLQRGDFAKADKALSDLSAIPWAADRAAVMKTRVQVKQGQAQEALTSLNSILGSAQKGSAKFFEATLAKAETLVALKKYDEALSTVQTVIDAAPPEDVAVQALAHNTLGDCYRAAGRPKDALFAYLQTDVLYDGDKEQHPRALYEISQLWQALRRDDRSAETMQRLKEQYPQSPWIAGPPGGR